MGAKPGWIKSQTHHTVQHHTTVCIDTHSHTSPSPPDTLAPVLGLFQGYMMQLNVKTKLLPPLTCKPALTPQRSTKDSPLLHSTCLALELTITLGTGWSFSRA